MRRPNALWLLGVAACHASAPPAPLSGTGSLPAAPAGFATCDLVTLEPSGAVTAWAIAPEGITRLGSTVIGPALELGDEEARAMAEPMHGDWADRDHLFVRTAKNTVKMVTAGGISPVEVPDLSRVRPPKPEGEEASADGEGMRFSGIDLVVGEGEAWWARCAWSFAYDGGYCGVWTSGRLWPRPRTITELADARRHEYPAHEPRGFSLDRDDGLACTAPGGAKTTITHAEDEVIYGTAWLSAEPPRLLVLYGPMAEFSSPPASRWELHDGCTVEPIARGESPVAGLGDLWSASERGGFAIYRGPTKLGHVVVKDAGYAQLRFRPAK